MPAMMLDDESGRDESGSPIDALEACFEAHGWSTERLGDDEVVASVQGSWTLYELRGVWRPEDRVLQFLCLPDIRVPADKRTTIHEAIGLINEQLWLGHFELWTSSGLAIYRNATLVDREGVLAGGDAETLVETAIDECDRFYPVFQFVLWGDKSPADAIAAAMIETQGEA